jgi:hypothetical protein
VQPYCKYLQCTKYAVRNIKLSCMACVSVQYILSHSITNWTLFGVMCWTYNKRLDFHYDFVSKFPTLRNVQLGVIVTLHRPSCNSSSIHVALKLTMHFLLILSKTLTVTLPNFANTLKIFNTSAEDLRKFCPWHDVNVLSVSSKQLYTRSIGWHKCFESVFNYHAEGRPLCISMVLCLPTMYFTSLQCLSQHLHNTACADE